MRVAIVACVHGNEQYGLEIGKRFPNYSFFIANPYAVKHNKRYIDTDLNRCFPGQQDGNQEERIAATLVTQLAAYDYVIDLHSTSMPCPLFGIVVRERDIALAKKLGLSKVVMMHPDYASGRALIDQVASGISLEIGPHERNENVAEVVDAINRFKKNTDSAPEIYAVFDIIRGNATEIYMQNFIPVRKGEVIAMTSSGTMCAQFDFIPVLVGEKSYTDVICLACSCQEIPPRPVGRV